MLQAVEIDEQVTFLNAIIPTLKFLKLEDGVLLILR